MRRFLFLFVFIILFSSCSPTQEISNLESDEMDVSVDISVEDKPTVSIKYDVINYEYMKAVWLSQFDMQSIYQSNGTQRSEVEFKLLLNEILNNLKNDGYNTIIVQVRPYADSFYPSEFYPVSNFVSGQFGRENIYDPFKIIIEFAHLMDFSVHAWINPMRAMTVKEIDSVPDKYLIKKWYLDNETNGEYVVNLDGRIYLNPAYDEVRKLIADGAKEICTNYDVDGVHIDDYFYPTTDVSFDKAAYDKYINNGGKASIDKFRNELLSLMVSGIYNSVKSVDSDILFGVSPAGNINNTFKKLYADVYTWCSQKGYLDYICPQIYFGLEHDSYDFISVYKTWSSIVKKKDIRIIVGMTLGKAKQGFDNYAGSGKNEWSEHDDILKRCLEYLSYQDDCSGISFFCYQYMYDPLSGISVSETENERKNMNEILNKLGQ